MKLWIDDVRVPPIGYDTWAKNYHDAISIIDHNINNIELISFDHDLGLVYDENGNELNGYCVSNYIESLVFNNIIDATTIKGIQIHTSNPVGSQKIKNSMLWIKTNYNPNLTIIHMPYETMSIMDGFGNLIKKE